MNSKWKVVLKNGGFFILLIIITAYIVFKDNDVHDIIKAVSQADFRYIALGIGAMWIFLYCEAYNIVRALRLFGYKIKLRCGLKYALTGFFFSSVTPSASGGQPMQIYHMYRDGIEVSHGTLALLFELLSFVTVTVLLAVAGLAFQHELIFSLGNVKYLLLLGVGLNVTVAVLLIFAIFSPKAIGFLASALIRAVSAFSREKAESLREMTERQLAEYGQSAGYFKKNKLIFVKTLVTTTVQMFSMYAVPYLVYRAFGFDDFHLLEVLLLQAVLYVSVSALPLPGALGVSESTFMVLFRTLFPSSVLGSAMILSRGISFYLFVLISGLFVAGFTLTGKKKKEKKHGLHNINCGGRQGYRQSSQALSGE